MIKDNGVQSEEVDVKPTVSRDDMLLKATETVEGGLSELGSTMAIISTVAMCVQTLVSNPELIKIIATAIVDVQEEIAKQQST